MRKSTGLFLPSEQRLIDTIINHNNISRQEMASLLQISEGTIRTHLMRIYAKMEINSIDQLRAHYNVERQKTCACCKRSLPPSAFKKADRKQCMACNEQTKQASMNHKMLDFLIKNGPATAAKIGAAIGKDSRTTGRELSRSPNLFCIVGHEPNPQGPDRPIWAIVQSKPEPSPEPPPSVITWRHSSPVATWTLSGQVVQKKGRHFVVKANGLRYEVAETSLV
jgi:DNA-binding CsgD family transcriptional regulator